MKKKFFIIFIIYSVCSFASKNDQHRDKMKELIKEIRKNTSKNRIIITQNGSEVYFKNGEFDADFASYVNGASQESLIYGEGLKLNNKTSKKSKGYLLERLKVIKENGKSVFSVNYSKSVKNRKVIASESKKTGFIGEEISSFAADTFNLPINGYNKRKVEVLIEAKNFLYILNPHKFRTIDEYFTALSKTNYDVLIIEPSLNGKFFSKEQIEKLKYKATGSRRLVIAYFSIGEAEDYRSYWKVEWNSKFPDWIEAKNENWEGNFIVKYWSSQWKEIVKSYQKRLDSIGVDGYYLDTIDSFYYFEDKDREQ